MAPHWKCGSGQPVAGSNPALSATAPRTTRVVRLSPVTMRARVRRSSLATFRFRQPALAIGGCRDRGYAVRHRAASAVRHGFRLRQRRARCATTSHGPAASATSWPRSGSTLADVTAVANCHLHADHAGQNAPSRASRSTSRRPSGRSPTRPTTRSSNGSTSPAPTTADRRRPRAVRRGSGSSRRPATRPATSRSWSRRRAATSSSPARPATRPASGPAIRTPLEGRSATRPIVDGVRPLDRAAASALEPVRVVRSATTAQSWTVETRAARMASDRRRYPSGAVLGGELAVPCTCNPL